MTDTERQLEEANDVIVSNKCNSRSAKNYCDKYLKAVDPLKDKWDKFAGEELDDWTDMGTAFPAFKRIFKDELNGTKGLDALKALLTNGVYTSDFLCKNIDIIKNELEK